MKYNVLLKCSELDYDYIIKKIISNNINIVKSYKKNNEYYFILNEDDYKTLLKLDYKKAIIYQSYSGIFNIINLIKYNRVYIILTIFTVAILFLSNYFIIKVNIHSNDVNLNKLIKYSLIDYKITDYSIKKKQSTLKKIKEEILKKYKDKIEWIEIINKGYKYDVYLIERKENNTREDYDKCHYVAKKSGTVTSIKAKKGVLMVQENNYVNQGDILISGEVIYNDELKQQVCADGKIMGEVWYEVDLSYPLVKTVTEYKKNVHYNISFNFLNKNYLIFRNKYNNIKTIRTLGNDVLGLNIVTSSKTKKVHKKVSEEKAINLMLKKAKENIELRSHNNAKIISENILKKYIKNDTIYMKVLITSEEELGVVQNY